MPLDSPAAANDAVRIQRGSFRVYVEPDGTVVVPDLAEPLIPLLRTNGANEALWRTEPCIATKPVLAASRRLESGLSLSELQATSTANLWRTHAMALNRLQAIKQGKEISRGAASLLDLKIELAARLLSGCNLCVRACGTDRTANVRGFCGLAARVQVSAYAMLYNEGPMVGAPTFSVFVRGCSLRCAFCYRRDDLRPDERDELPPEGLARVLDIAAERGARSWHFLGGDPDESLPAILQSLALTLRSVPVVWDSALMLAPAALELLRGVVDVWLPDFKFGNDACGRQAAGIDGYMEAVTRNLMALRDQEHVVVRHMTRPGHACCCTNVVERFVRATLPGSCLQTFPCYSHAHS